MKRIITLAAFLIITVTAKTQTDEKIAIQNSQSGRNGTMADPDSRRLNFFVFTKEKNKKLDLLSIYTLTRARIKSFFHHHKLYVINARSAEDATNKIEEVLKRKNKLISNIWFDSHGHYGNRYSSFKIGTDQFSYKNINDTAATKYLERLASYCDEQTKIGLGSCYAGADFYFPATDSTPAFRMNGDSLMIGLGKIFKRSSIYASESWVMAKPGIFTDKFGFAGYPLNRRFKDSVYAPVWERIGNWRTYSLTLGQIKSIPTVALDRSGNIHIRERQYNDFKKSKNKIAKTLKGLKPGLAKFS